MPRPTDVYATLGAPGVYQATPSASYRLPTVYVVPPEEDNQDVFCLFHSESTSPATFESFYRHPLYTRGNSNSPTFTDLRALDHALTYLQRQSALHNRVEHGPRSVWEHEERRPHPSRNYSSSTTSSTSTRSSFSDVLRGSSAIEAETRNHSNARYLFQADGQYAERWQDQSKPVSRRSSVFGDRPLDYDVSEPCSGAGGEDQPVSKAQPMTLRGRAAMALKGLGGAVSSLRRPDGHIPMVPECKKEEERAHGEAEVYKSWFEPERLRGKRSRRSLARPLGSHPNVDIHVVSGGGDVKDACQISPSPRSPLSGQGRLHLNRRKSMTQLFGLARGPGEGVFKADNAQCHPAAKSTASLTLAAKESKLSRRKSMTQLLGLGRPNVSSAALSEYSSMTVDTDGTCTGSRQTHVTGTRLLDEPHSTASTAGIHMTGTDDNQRSTSSTSPAHLLSVSSESHVSVATSGTPAPAGRRKYFLSKRSFSFLDLSLHRRLAANSAPQPSQHAQHTPPVASMIDTTTAQCSPDSFSDITASSCSVPTTPEYGRVVIGDEMERTTGKVTGLEPNLMSGSRLELDGDVDFSPPLSPLSPPPPFGLDTPDEDDVESETGEETRPTLELAVQLDSLSFGQLVFDPESFMDIYD